MFTTRVYNCIKHMTDFIRQHCNALRLTVILGFALLLLSAFMLQPQSSGAPPSSTGAPNEHSCNVASCHDDATLNAGNGALICELGDSIRSYQPAQEYHFRVRMSRQSCVRFGYQLVVLDTNGRNAGTLVLRDAKRTQIISNLNELLDRKYATYTYDGTAALKTGYADWELSWIAPAQNAGPLMVYSAAVAANNDDSDKGDEVYTHAAQIQAGVSSVDDNAGFIQTIRILNPVCNDVLKIQCNQMLSTKIHVRIYSSDGRCVALHELRNSAENSIDIQTMSTGVYVVEFSGESIHSSSIIVKP